MIIHKLPQEEQEFIWERWSGGMCDLREVNLAREMFFAQNKKGRYLEG